MVDAGCGAGLSCAIAPNMGGAGSETIGIDRTQEMVDKAIKTPKPQVFKDGTFQQGILEELPVEDWWADFVISNGAINLAPGKSEVFKGLNRVLKPGGRMQIADIPVDKPIPESAKRNIDLWNG